MAVEQTTTGLLEKKYDMPISQNTDAGWKSFLLFIVCDNFLPYRHEVEDVWHPRTVTQQITQTELEDYSRNQDTVPARGQHDRKALK